VDFVVQLAIRQIKQVEFGFIDCCLLCFSKCFICLFHINITVTCDLHRSVQMA